MTFPPYSTQKDFSFCGCGAALYEGSDRAGLCCDPAESHGCLHCDELRLLGGARSDIDLRHGVLVAHTVYLGPYKEICLMPFLVPPTGSRIVWEARLLRIGSALISVDPWRELEPLEDVLEGQRLKIETASSPRAAIVRDFLRDPDLVIGVDSSSLGIIARLPLPEGVDVATLEADIPWRALYGRDLEELISSWGSSTGPGIQSTLRLAALMGHVLDLGTPSEGLRPIEHLLAKFEAPDLLPHVHPHEEVSHARA